MTDEEKFPQTITNPEGLVFRHRGEGCYLARTKTGKFRKLSQFVVNCVSAGMTVKGFVVKYEGKPDSFAQRPRRRPASSTQMIGAD